MSVPDFNCVLKFLDQVKNAFIYKPKKYRRLQVLWQSYLKKNIDFTALLEELSGLLSDDPPLIEGFNKLLPPEFKLKIIESNKQFETLKHQRFEEGNSFDEPPAKKAKSVQQNDGSYSMYGSWKEFSFFDEVRQLLRNECTYLNFLRCVQLFNKNLIDGMELLEILHPFISKSPNVLARLKLMLRHHLENGINQVTRKRQERRCNRPTSLAEEVKEYEIDFSSCRKMGSSYRALTVRPHTEHSSNPACSGRTDLCREVLNDIWVSFPLWSEDPATTSESQGGCKITSIQEFFYKCEDERFELDIVIDQVSSAIKTLEEVQNKMNLMTQDDIMSFQLDDSLGGSSNVLQRKVIERIYGDKAKDLLDGLKMKPFIGVPIALRRLKAKQQEWIEHRIKFNKIWKENTEKHSQRSLNCELALVKQNDHKDARAKVIINEAEAILEESQMLSSIYGDECAMKGKQFIYSDKETFNDLNDLIGFNLNFLSKEHTSDHVGSGTTATLNGPPASNASSLSNDKNLLLFCNKALAVISKLYRTEDNSSNTSHSQLFASNLDDIATMNDASVSPEQMTDMPFQRNNPPITFRDAVNCTSSSLDEVVMYQTSRWLILVSIHHKLYSRLVKIRSVSERESLDRDVLEREDGSSRKKSKAVYLDISGRENCGTLYNFALAVLKSHVGGACESSTYEEHIRRTMMKVRNDSSFNYNDASYWIISLDKLLKNVLRELQQLAGDEATRKGIELFETFHNNKEILLGGTSHMTYRHNCLSLLSKDLCYKITFKKKWHKVVVELLDVPNGEFSREGANKVLKNQTWQEYIANFLSSDVANVHSIPFLRRNLRKEVPVDMISMGSDQLAFRPDSFKLVFSSSSHSVLYRSRWIRATPEESRRQTLHRHNKFIHHWNGWKSTNLTPAHEQRFSEWMFGVKKNSTKVIEISDKGKSPYRTYRKYLTFSR